MKVLVADPQPSVRHALSVWISGKIGWEVVGESGDSSDLLKKMSQLKPELTILDKDLPGDSTKELVAGIRQASKRVAVILLYYDSLEDLQVEQLMVDFFASKVDPPARMLDTLLKAQTWLENQEKKGLGQ